MGAQENRTQRLIAWIAVALVHLLVFWWLAFSQARPQPDFPPAIELWLAPMGGAPADAEGGGGGLAAAPSVVHAPPEIFKTFADAPVAPPTPAPEPPPLVVAAAPLAAPAPSGGQGTIGEGQGQGQGAGEGPGAGGSGQGGAGLGGAGQGGAGLGAGSGAGTGAGAVGASWARELSAAEKRSLYPREGLRRRADGRVELSCVMRAGNRVNNCRILAEQPRGMGFASAAIETARLRGVRAPRVNGQPLLNERIRLTVAFDHGVIDPARPDPGIVIRAD